MKFASIDIGSNAIRLLLCNVYENKDDAVFKKNELVRIPIRLGEDAFLYQNISEKRAEQLIKTMKAFKYLIDVFEAVDHRACATSAMRDAKNGRELIARIKWEVGLNVEIIDGKTEAEIIYSNHIAEHLEPNQSYLYIDVGGGSTELTLFSDKKCIISKSFNIGTIRMLHNQVNKELWEEFKNWIRDNTKLYKPIIAIGSGGNINKLFKMSRKKDNKPMTYDDLKESYDYLCKYSFEERITELGLNPDRADVIIPAAKIFLTIMKTAEIDRIVIPQIGLSDGIIHLLYENYKRKQTASA